MNKLTKGAIASAAGIILLMGGAGTLASWNAASTAGTATTVNAGQLAVAPTGTTGVWKDNGVALSGTTKVVPGDVLTYVQDYTVTTSGANLKFTMGVTNGAISAVSTANAPDVQLAALLNTVGNTNANLVLGTTPNISLSGSTYSVTTAGTTTVTATLTVTVPFGSAIDNSTQLGNVKFAAGAITLTQVAS